MFRNFSYRLLSVGENETFENFFAKSAKEEGGGGSENSRKNLLGISDKRHLTCG